jgi:hypothetical protein
MPGGRPSKKTPALVGKLEYAFSIGSSIEEACFYAGIHKDTYYEWVKADVQLSDRFDALREQPVFQARETVVKGIKRDPKLAMDFLARKRKDEFSLRNEHTGKDGEQLLPAPILGGATTNEGGDDE